MATIKSPCPPCCPPIKPRPPPYCAPPCCPPAPHPCYCPPPPYPIPRSECPPVCPPRGSLCPPKCCPPVFPGMDRLCLPSYRAKAPRVPDVDQRPFITNIQVLEIRPKESLKHLSTDIPGIRFVKQTPGRCCTNCPAWITLTYVAPGC